MQRRVLRTWADDAVAFADALADLDPSWGSETFGLAGGRVVLCGPGMYVNRAMAIGWDGPLSSADIDLLEARSAAVGVPASVEVTDATDRSVTRQLTERGFESSGETIALRRELTDLDQLSSPGLPLVIESANEHLLDVWRATSASGWGHTTEPARHASDAFAGAAALVDGDNLVLARDASDGRPVGCASITIRNGVATLGGMSTLPAERGRGVQSALVGHRLRVARALGCQIATTSTAPGSTSERNLIRCGFEPWFTINTLTQRR